MQQLKILPKLTLNIPSEAKFTVKKAGRTDGYDGHSYRAYYYWPEKMPDIDPSTVDGINSIKSKYPKLRDASKEPTFLLTYNGTYHGLMKNVGFSEPEAKRIESNFHELYKESRDWVASKMKSASENGYIEVAFGLRVRTPALSRTILDTKSTPYEAQSEYRTGANALGQSYCLLNSRAGSEVMREVRKSEYRMDIKPLSQIHDAQYYLVKDNMDVLLYTNKLVTEAAAWQELPEIKHDIVKLSGSLDIFYPSWDKGYTLPRDATENDVYKLVEKMNE